MELKNNLDDGKLTRKPCHTSVSGHFKRLKVAIFRCFRAITLQKMLTYFEKYLY